MRIVLATPIYPPEAGGPATYTVELAQRLRGAHHIVVVAYTDTVEAVPSTHLIGVSKKFALPVRLYKFYKALLREAKQSDIIYVQNAVAAGLPAVFAGRRAKRPVILKFVGDEAWERATQAGRTKKTLEDFYKAPEGGLRTKIFLGVQRFVLRRAKIVTTPSAYLADLLVQYYGLEKEKVVVNYNAFDAAVLPEQTRVPHQIMTAVRLVAWKGVDGIIRALPHLKQKYPDAKLIVAGDGPERESLEKLAVWEDVAAGVQFVGSVAKEKVLEIESSSAVQVLNSRYEGLPHGALESFATRTPFVATNIPGTNEAVYDGETGLLVPVGDDKALAAAIEKIFADSQLASTLAEGGSKILKEKFSWAAHIAMLEQMFLSVHPNTHDYRW